MSDYRCVGCNGHIIDGQTVVLETVVVSVVDQRLGNSKISHAKCYRPTGDMLSDFQWYITDLGPEHWQNCDVGDEDCYLCAEHVAIRDRWKGSSHE